MPTIITDPKGRKLSLRRVLCEDLRPGAHVVVDRKIRKVLRVDRARRGGDGAIQLQRKGWSWRPYEAGETIVLVTKAPEGS